MMNKFVKIRMRDNKLEAAAIINLFNECKMCNIKIDTGCSHTAISSAKLGMSKHESKALKAMSIEKGVPYMKSYGVSDTAEDKKRDKELIESGRIMEVTAVKFEYTAKNFTIAGCNIGDTKVHVNFDRKCSILIGMDILKDWDMHIGKAADGEAYFLACPYNQLNDEYYTELGRLFKIGEIINALEVRKRLK